MNARAARLLHDFAYRNGLLWGRVRRWWAGLPRARRAAYRRRWEARPR